MAPSKTRFYLISFVKLGLVIQDPGTGLYSLGPGAIRLGLTALEQFDVVSASKSAVHELADQLGFSTYLFVWGTHGPTMVYRADGRHWTSLDVRVGSVLPLLNSAAGRAYLACLPQSMTNTLVKKEIRDTREHGGRPPSPDKIIRLTRAAGIAVAKATLLAEITAIASPILDYSALPAAVISIAGRIGRFDDRPEIQACAAAEGCYCPTFASDRLPRGRSDQLLRAFGVFMTSANGMVRPCSCPPPAIEAGKGRQRQGARHVPDTQRCNCRDWHRYRQELVPRRRSRRAWCHGAPRVVKLRGSFSSRSRYFIFSPDAFTTFAHLSASSTRNLLNSAGELLTN